MRGPNLGRVTNPLRRKGKSPFSRRLERPRGLDSTPTSMELADQSTSLGIADYFDIPTPLRQQAVLKVDDLARLQGRNHEAWRQRIAELILQGKHEQAQVLIDKIPNS